MLLRECTDIFVHILGFKSISRDQVLYQMCCHKKIMLYISLGIQSYLIYLQLSGKKKFFSSIIDFLVDIFAKKIMNIKDIFKVFNKYQDINKK